MSRAHDPVESNPLDMPATELAGRLRDGSLSATALAEACLRRIEETEPAVKAWAFLDPELVLAQAARADAQRESGVPLGPLHGLPVGIKDIIDTADMPTEYGTAIHRGRRPFADATIVARLRAAGATVVGKTVTSEHAVYTPGPTTNPHDPARTPGGSSSGSAAAVAARMVPLALATQTNGSTIRPASFCGAVGYKPSLGLLPRDGILKQATMLDQPGLMARDVAGVALLASALMGPDIADEQSTALPVPCLLHAASQDAHPRLAFVRGPYWDRVDASARNALESFVDALDVPVTTLDLPAEFQKADPVLKAIMNSGIAQAYRDDYAQAKHLMADVLIGIIEDGRRLSAVDLVDAFTAREALRRSFAAIASPFDAIVTPATLGVAPLREDGTGDPIMATSWTLLGAPALTLPLLTGEAGMPLGVQLVGGLLGDEALIRAAAWLERRPRR